MAVITEIEEQKEDIKNSTASAEKQFSAALDPSDPLGFLEKVFEFVEMESVLFKSDSLVKTVVRMVNDKVKSEDKQSKEVEIGRNCEVEKKIKNDEENAKPVPNKGNGLDMDNYSWGQSLQEVNITIPVPTGTMSRFITCEMKKNHLTVGLMDQPPVLDGELYRPVNVGDCFWTLEDRKSISILLTKEHQKEWWQYLVEGEPKIDTNQIEPEMSPNREREMTEFLVLRARNS